MLATNNTITQFHLITSKVHLHSKNFRNKGMWLKTVPFDGKLVVKVQDIGSCVWRDATSKDLV